ncbi:hypothetical protein G9A89_008235 [Geosiphon pyriformis]|nr:hypothetical protein G9A89_008235 [Geosiphon pyriformis]
MHLRSTLPVFAPASVMAPAPQMAATSFAVQIQDPNEQLINRLTANLAQKDLCKFLIPKKKIPKTNKYLCQAGLADNNNVISLICKAQVADYFIDLILNSKLSVSIIAKYFLEAIDRKINKLFTRLMTNIHGNKKKDLGIAKAVFTTPSVPKQKQEKEQSEESDDNEKKTAELAYTIFISNDKPLDNVKANKEGIIINGKLICWPYYDILRKTFDKKPGKKAKYSYWWHGLCARCWCNKSLYFPSYKYKFCLIYYKDWEPISLILRKELKKVQKFFENKPPKIQSLVVEQKKLFPEERKMDIENLLARNSPIISKEDIYSFFKIDAMLDKFNGAVFFSTIDLTAKFWQVEMDPKSRKKTVFITKYGTVTRVEKPIQSYEET